MKNISGSGLDNPAFEDDIPSSLNTVSIDTTANPTLVSSSTTRVDNMEMEEVPTINSTDATTVLSESLTKMPGSCNGSIGKLSPPVFQTSPTPPPMSPPPPPAFHENAAVCVRNAHKSYRKGTPVLKDFNMTVPIGSIYSLLGSSGCGKTTMLSCCVGIRKLDKGEIFIFGHTPGTRESGVPGRRVGFMPQELSVYGELTIQEALNFYGRIYGMRRDQMFDSTSFLIDFLDLPEASRRVGSLSGGQMRRVSLALSLIHDPELLILDEPTVGVDPLLRESIWNHLVKLVTSGRTTVIITTHYIEEARQSNVIGIMRNGRLLTEKSPQALLKEFKVSHLEDIVLSLCRMDRDQKKNNKKGAANEENGNDKDAIVDISLNNGEKPKLDWTINAFTKWKVRQTEPTLVKDEGVVGLRYSSSGPASIVGSTSNGDVNKSAGLADATEPSQAIIRRRKLSTRENMRHQESTTTRRLIALLIKNFIILMRNVGFLIFIFLVPAIQVILICLTIGSDPKGLLIGVINPELCSFEGQNWKKVVETCPVEEREDDVKTNGTLSCFYLAHLPVESFILEREISESEALKRIQKGYTYGYVQFPENYTENVMCKFGGSCPKGNKHPPSDIVLELDMSNKQIGQTMKRIFIDAYAKSMETLKKTCKRKVDDGTLTLATNVPYSFKKPVYGRDDTSFREFLAPSILLGLLFFFPLCSSGVSYISEKKTGTLDRALVAGVGTAELMGGFLISQVGILLGQAGFAFLILTQVFQIEILGSISLALFLTILVGISGMSAGFLIAMFCTEEVQAVLLAIGTFFPNILLAGMVWPLEGMEKALQYVSYLLPCTLACESMRSIISRGWSLAHRNVWPGFATTLAWIVFYWVLAVLVHRLKSKG